MLCSRSAVDGESVAITSVAASSSRKQLRSAWRRREAKKGGEEEKQRRRRWEREMEDEIDFMNIIDEINEKHVCLVCVESSGQCVVAVLRTECWVLSADI